MKNFRKRKTQLLCPYSILSFVLAYWIVLEPFLIKDKRNAWVKKRKTARAHGWIYVEVWMYVSCVRQHSCWQSSLKQNITNVIVCEMLRFFMNLTRWKLLKRFSEVCRASEVASFYCFLSRISVTLITIIIIFVIIIIIFIIIIIIIIIVTINNKTM